MFNNYYYFLLLFLIFLLVWFKNPRYYLTFFWINIIPKKATYMDWVKFILLITSWLLLILSAADFYLGTTTVSKSKLAHKYVLSNDASGSMTEFNVENGVGKNLKCLLFGNKTFLDSLNKRENKTQDLVGCILFSNSSFILSYLTEDANFVYEKLKNVNFSVSPLGSGTRGDAAIWGAVDLLLSSVDSSNNKNLLSNRMYGAGTEFKRDENIDSIIQNYKKLISGASIILFTDGQFFNSFGDNSIMSTYKLLALCKELGIKVYLLSIDPVEDGLKTGCLNTGGFSAQISFDPEEFRKMYSSILDSEAKEYSIEGITINKSFATVLGLIAFFIFLIYICLKHISLNFSEL